MAISLSSLTSSFSSLSFSSQISSKPRTLSLPRIRSPPNAAPLRRNRPSAIVASSSSTAVASVAGGTFAPTTAGLEGMSLEKYVKSRLPGGFAAQKIIGTGRRKCAIARVVLQEGTGKVIINYRDAKEYLQGNPLWLQYIRTPLVTLGYDSGYDVFVKAHGGGLSGQAQAISLGIARALLKVSENHRAPLRKEGLLTRDSRVVERKKVGLKKARKAPQYSKR
ncbi:30S ribosomal protein S9, chloroplastic [Phoenix dactylifera]|uniref:Small ribosomal subunit protein uS9c n=1 Tax=Phoenix dactylifera TaxID=42345 RepID=A0A8B7CDR7_PHODC|nr:30S ribosomal protein S9, chloroplastic [Phoenix dactylifera]XP_008797008.1 30S ribosomal protein S9, chloroplastic [Phoenix dactylifera]